MVGGEADAGDNGGEKRKQEKLNCEQKLCTPRRLCLHGLFVVIFFTGMVMIIIGTKAAHELISGPDCYKYQVMGSKATSCPTDFRPTTDAFYCRQAAAVLDVAQAGPFEACISARPKGCFERDNATVIELVVNTCGAPGVGPGSVCQSYVRNWDTDTCTVNKGSPTHLAYGGMGVLVFLVVLVAAWYGTHCDECPQGDGQHNESFEGEFNTHSGP
eukprot:Hpha_TRINITY_DN6989_c0_g1::TRINITY_DN6989_c0_g1_i1::g.139417::m.139417